MNAFDIALLVLAAALVVYGMVKGLVRILVGLSALVAAFLLAAQYHQPLAERLSGFDLSIEPRRLIAYALIFVGVMLVGSLIAFFVRKLLRAAMLGWADRLAGAALGFLVAALASALVVLPLIAYLPQSDGLLARSVLAPYVTVVADVANRMVPEDFSRRYRQRVQDLRRFWRDQLEQGITSRDPAV